MFSLASMHISHIHEPRSGEPIFFAIFEPPVSDVFLASMHISHIHEPRSGEPIFFAYFEPP